MSTDHISKSIQDTAVIATDILARFRPGSRATVLALYGELGSGKTTFVQQLAAGLGVARTIQSPTFVIMRRYPLKDGRFDFLFHLDAYRLEHERELMRLGWEEIIAEPKHLVVIEWADRVEKLLPAGCFPIRFEFVDETIRRITF